LLEKRQALEDEKSKLNNRVTAMPKTLDGVLDFVYLQENGQRRRWPVAN
jgi:tyrosine-protein kinase Etk/Wzc